MVVVPLARKGFLRPKDQWEFPKRESWPQDWHGHSFKVDPAEKVRFSIFRAWIPYILVALFLLTSRFFAPVKSILSSISLEWTNMLQTSISTKFQPFYLPGFLFILVGLLTLFFHKTTVNQVKKAVLQSAKAIVGPAIALGFAVPMVKIFIYSGVSGGIEKMPVILAKGAAAVVGQGWTLAAPVIGALGAFIAGSNTFSNMMFSLFQFATAVQTGLIPGVIVALQAVGGAAGNMICIHNVVAASAVVGLLGKEGLLIRKTIIPMTYYLIVAALLGIILMDFFIL
jgi:lactate permease